MTCYLYIESISDGMGDPKEFKPLFSLSYMPDTAYLCFGMMLALSWRCAKVLCVISNFYQPKIRR